MRSVAIFLYLVATSEAFQSRFIQKSCSRELSSSPSIGRTFIAPLALRNPFQRDVEEKKDTAVAIMDAPVTTASPESATEVELAAPVVVEQELSETQKLMKQVKDAGVAGVISYALWELAFWAVSVPVCIFGYREVTGHWPDFNNAEDMQKLGAEAFAFVNFARFAVPLRIGLALSTTGWIQTNVVDRFMKKDETQEGANASGSD